MPVKYRLASDAGNCRAQVVCPNCSCHCLLYRGPAVGGRARQYYAACLNHLCGWRGLGVFEIIKTTEPSAWPANAGERPAPEAQYRFAHDAGRFRVQVECPHCGSRCLVYSSGRTSSRSRQYYLECRHTRCGWRGIGIFEVTQTTHPPPAPMRQGAIPDTVPDTFFDNPPPLAGHLF